MRGEIQGGVEQGRPYNEGGRIQERHPRILRCCPLLELGFLSLRFISFCFVLIGFMVPDYAHFELFVNFPTICLYFVVFARITRTNDSKSYLEAQLLIGLARSEVYFFNLNYLADLWPDVQLQICSPGFLGHMLIL